MNIKTTDRDYINRILKYSVDSANRTYVGVGCEIGETIVNNRKNIALCILDAMSFILNQDKRKDKLYTYIDTVRKELDDPKLDRNRIFGY